VPHGSRLLRAAHEVDALESLREGVVGDVGGDEHFDAEPVGGANRCPALGFGHDEDHEH
jgi:hypothetical protein